MDSTSTSAFSSFGSTSEPHVGDMAMKVEPGATETYENSVWAHIFDENGVVCLDDDDEDDESMMSPAAIAAPRPGQSLVDVWGVNDAAMANSTSPEPAASMADEETKDEDAPRAATAYPTHFIELNRQSNGRPYPLSKPILRDDGLLLVGTEMVPLDHRSPMPNRIFVLDFRNFHSSQPTPFVHTAAEVRDLQWLDKSNYAVAAVGMDLHLVSVPANAHQPSCHLLPALPRVHKDAIREVAINCSSSVTIATGGFDESIVLSTLSETGDAISATMAGTVAVHDVVSSLRWSPVDQQLVSWTTDGGEFQVSDKRMCGKAQMLVQLDAFSELQNMGGLFTHEYISEKNVVLGFQSGQLVFLDLRMPGKQICYGFMQSPIGCVGELRRAADGTCGLFGIGGFATATVATDCRELQNFAGARPSHGAKLGFDNFKTSGDFSLETGSILAVSDNIGVVSVYNGNGASRSATAALLATG